MEGKDRLDCSFLSAYEEELQEIFRIYLEDINYLIVQFEITKNEFPVEIQNEIRAMYGHLARAATAESPEVAKANVEKMRSHTKRALLDCFKYCCVIYTDQYTDFFKRYDGVDLSYLNDGKFLSEVHGQYDKAKNALLAAKAKEVTNASDEELFDAYQDAFNLYGDLCETLNSVTQSADFLKHKATKKDKLANISFVIGAVGTLFGIIGVVLTLVLA